MSIQVATIIYRRFAVISKCLLLLTMLPLAAQAHSESHIDERLSEWLAQHQFANTYPLGLMWLVPSENVSQSTLKQQLLDELDRKSKKNPSLISLSQRLNQFPVTGRATIALADPQWLSIHPADDPILKQSQFVKLPARPTSVTLLLDNGQLCQVPFVEGTTSDTYIKQCLGDYPKVDYAWVAQPDGRSFRFGVAIWNIEPQDPPAPGAWIWAPQRGRGLSVAFSDGMGRFLATQGPAPDLSLPKKDTYSPIHIATPYFLMKTREKYTANDWGTIGLLQTPSARMEESGEVRFQLSRIYPYTIGTVMFQPFDWMEAGFRYVNIKNHLYDPSRQISSLSFVDKNFDFKLRLIKEHAYLPQLALGFQDMAGTGPFSSEYLVASKRTGNFDWNLGVAWGYLGRRSIFPEPLSAISHRFSARAIDVGHGGLFNANTYFRGPAGLFGGVQWQTPFDPLILKLEYDGNNYQDEPFNEAFLQKSPINVGLVYRLFPWLDLSAGVERGTTAMLGLSLHTSLAKLQQAKILDQPAPPVLTTMPSSEPNWSETVAAIHALTGWSVVTIYRDHSTLTLQIEGGGYRGQRLETLVSILHRDSPANISDFKIIFVQYAMKIDEVNVNRAVWLTEHTQAVPPSQKIPSMVVMPPAVNASSVDVSANKLVWQTKNFQFSGGVAPNVSQIMGGPNAFMVYQVGAIGNGEIKFNPSTTITGTAEIRVFDNYGHFNFDPTSKLPPVRTEIRQYLVASRYTLPNLQFTHAKQLTENQFVSVYGGLLEMMFAGIGAEWMYRPWHSPWAIGVDINRVQQRGFAQDFSLQHYQVNTGHLTLYWDTGWAGLLTQISVGQYLAGDRGATIDISRRFSNGVVVGAYATRTNVTYEQFGEGSFNKGIYLSVPFDAVLPISTPGAAYFNWVPILRDGGAELSRAITLYDLTSERDLVNSSFGPSFSANAPFRSGEPVFNP